MNTINSSIVLRKECLLYYLCNIFMHFRAMLYYSYYPFLTLLAQELSPVCTHHVQLNRVRVFRAELLLGV